METARRWQHLGSPPKDALKKIEFGPLKGKYDINPIWRFEVMDKVVGPYGEAWGYEIVKLWTEPGSNGEVCVLALVKVVITGDSYPSYGVGGNLLIQNTKNGLRTNDEAYKMALTDAIGVALKPYGVAADIYRGRYDTKYQTKGDVVSPELVDEIRKTLKRKNIPENRVCSKYQLSRLEDLNSDQGNAILTKLHKAATKEE
jgi:hypothetical protein